MFTREAATAGSAYLHGFEGIVVDLAVFIQNSASDLENDLPDGGSKGNFDQSGIGHMSREGKGFGAGRFRGSQAPEFIDTLLHNHRNKGQSFHVVDHGWFTKESLLGRERRFGIGHSALALDRGQQRCFFSADKGSGTFHHIDAEFLATAKDIITQDAIIFSNLNGLADAGASQRILHADIDIAFIGTDRAGSYHHAFDHAVGIAFQDRTIHESTRITLVPVANHVFFLVVFFEGKFPFQSGGEPTTATSTQTTLFIQLAQVLRTVSGVGSFC